MILEEADIRAYVAAAATAQGLALGAAPLDPVVAVVTRTAAIAAPLLEFDLPEDTEPAPVFRP
ncbi:MAG: DUF4089 domain-containing protein [Betaproteobacteria bacterium]